MNEAAEDLEFGDVISSFDPLPDDESWSYYDEVKMNFNWMEERDKFSIMSWLESYGYFYLSRHVGDDRYIKLKE